MLDFKKPDAPDESDTPHRRWLGLTRDNIIGILGVFAGVVIGVAAIVFQHYDLEHLGNRLTANGMIEVSKSGDYILLNDKPYAPPKGPLQVQFWTPSVRTKETPTIKDWERLDDNKKVDAFGELLTAKDKDGKSLVRGYRRYDVTGSGLGGFKAGTWWVATLDGRLIDFIRLYHRHWTPGADDIYMEIASATSGYSR